MFPSRSPRLGAVIPTLGTAALLGVVATTPAIAAASDRDSGSVNAAGQERSLISALRGPVVLDGKRYSPKQMKRFASNTCSSCSGRAKRPTAPSPPSTPSPR